MLSLLRVVDTGPKVARDCPVSSGFYEGRPERLIDLVVNFEFESLLTDIGSHCCLAISELS